MKKKPLVIIACADYANYPEPPQGYSASELFDCPKCGEKMWLSSKKKGYLLFHAMAENDVLFGCYICIEKLLN